MSQTEEELPGVAATPGARHGRIPSRGFRRDGHFRSVFEHLPLAIVTVSPDLRVIDVNPALEQLTDRMGLQLRAARLRVALPWLQDADEEMIRDVVAGRRTRIQVDREQIRAGDGRRWLRTSAVRDGADDAMPPLLVIAVEDVAAERADLGRLEHRATHDGLTGLVNRSFALEHLRRAQARSARNGQHLAALFIDIDDFKAVNDTYGHAAGDLALIEVARGIRAMVRPADTVARLGGDEFVVICEDLGADASTALDEVIGIARRIAHQLGAPCPTAGRRAAVAASIGIALTTADSPPTLDLLAVADQAMYAAKAAGGARWLVHPSGRG